MVDCTQIDSLLKTLKNLEFEEHHYNREIERNQHLLKTTVNSRVKTLNELAKCGIRNTFDLRVYLAMRQRDKIETLQGER